jgi:hypothetical protein
MQLQEEPNLPPYAWDETPPNTTTNAWSRADEWFPETPRHESTSTLHLLRQQQQQHATNVYDIHPYAVVHPQVPLPSMNATPGFDGESNVHRSTDEMSMNPFDSTHGNLGSSHQRDKP